MTIKVIKISILLGNNCRNNKEFGYIYIICIIMEEGEFTVIICKASIENSKRCVLKESIYKNKKILTALM